MLSSLQGESGRGFNPESTDREEGRVVTQNNHLVGARLDKTRTSRIRSLSGEFQTVSGRNLPADAGWEPGTDITAPRGRPRTRPQQLQSFLDALTSCRLAVVLWAGRAELARSRGGLPGPLPEVPFLSLVLRGIPHKFPHYVGQSSAENRAGRIDFLPRLLAFWILWSAGGSVAPRSRLPGSPPPFGVEKKPVISDGVFFLRLLRLAVWKC